jgi:tryptophan-rich sensory protein
MGFMEIIKLVVSIVICQAVGVASAIFSSAGVNGWYGKIIKPAFTPPAWVFGPVWTVMYLLMGISLFLILRRDMGGQKEQIAVAVFGVQLILNFLWTVIFFGMRQPLAAFIEILLLWAAILTTMIFFYKFSKTAAFLLLPYLLWVSFAAVLNAAIVKLN